MREPVHDSVIRFRANAALIASAERKARREGMSLSEFLRQALRRELKEAA